MLILTIGILVSIAAGLAAWAVARRWPRADPTAPNVAPASIGRAARRHARLVRLVRERLDPGAATGLALSAAIAVVLAGAFAIAVLLLMIHTDTGFARFDRAASLFGDHHATKLSTAVLRVWTQLGGALVIITVAALVAIVESIRQRTFSVFLFMAMVVGGQLLVADLTKWLVGRTRPAFDRLVGFSGSSFPSGHAVAAAASFAAIALVVGRGRSAKMRAVLAGVAIGLAVGIGFTRIMLGVHWLTDVLGGLAMGWAWFAICSIAFGGRRLRFGAPAEVATRAVPSETVPDERSGVAPTGS